MVQLNRDLVLACRLDRMVEYDLMAIDLIAELVLESRDDILGCD